MNTNVKHGQSWSSAVREAKMKISTLFSTLVCATLVVLVLPSVAQAGGSVKGKNGKCEVTVNKKKYILNGCSAVLKTSKTEAMGFCYPRLNYACTWKLK